MIPTIVIQIGNSDDKLTQKEWSEYVAEIGKCIECRGHTSIHFFAVSSGDKPWQNACWVLECSSLISQQALRKDVEITRKKFRQGSVAWMVGETKFI